MALNNAKRCTSKPKSTFNFSYVSTLTAVNTTTEKIPINQYAFLSFFSIDACNMNSTFNNYPFIFLLPFIYTIKNITAHTINNQSQLKSRICLKTVLGAFLSFSSINNPISLANFEMDDESNPL